MGRGGAETWLMNVWRHIDRERFLFDFLVHDSTPGEFDDELRSQGSRILVRPYARDPVRYSAAMAEAVRARGYTVIHSHVAYFSGWVLGLARGLGIAGRIAHSHNDFAQAQRAWPRAAYEGVMRKAIQMHSTRGLACSLPACSSLFGSEWQAQGKYEVLHYGYDFSRFTSEHIGGELRRVTRRALGIDEDAFVIGHIGHFSRQKNHEFIVELAAARRLRGHTRDRYVLVGGGGLRDSIERSVVERQLGEAFVFTGVRADVPELLAAFDVMILPSRWEGLGIVVLEAQASAVPSLVSDRVPEEAVVIDDLVTQAPLETGAWLEALAEIENQPRPQRDRAVAAMRESRFGLERNVERLSAIYEQEAARAR